MKIVAVIVTGAFLAAAACGGDGDLAGEGEASVPAEQGSSQETVSDAASGEPHMDEHSEGAHAEGDGPGGTSTFGEPGDPQKADRVIAIAARDDLSFDPASIHIHEGETITFRIAGAQAIHDFTIGDVDAQQAHAKEMQAMDGAMEHHGDVNAITVPAGATVELTWTFTKTGTFLYGCHQPGHYDGGMVGTISVDE